MHIERVNETAGSTFNPSGTLAFSYARLLSTISDGYILLVQVKLLFEKWVFWTQQPKSVSQMLFLSLMKAFL